jgi:hypothetical protein
MNFNNYLQDAKSNILYEKMKGESLPRERERHKMKWWEKGREMA